MYFGPFPALLRMPVLLLTDRLDGRLTALSMLVGWFVLAAAVTVLVRRVRGAARRRAGRALRGGRAGGDRRHGHRRLDGRVPRVAAVGVPRGLHLEHGADGGDGGEPDRRLGRSERRRIVLTTALALATMLTRITAGWAMAARRVGDRCLVPRRRRRRRCGRRGAGLAARRRRRSGGADRRAGQLGEVPSPLPLPDRGPGVDPAQRPSPLRDRRQRRRPRGLQFVRTTLAAYLRPDGVRFSSVFPFISPPADPPAAVGDVLLDESWRTGSVPALMPLLFLLTLWGARRRRARRRGGGAADPAARLRGDDRRRDRLRPRRPALHQRVHAAARPRGDHRVRRHRPTAVACWRRRQARRRHRRLWRWPLFGIAAHAAIGLVSARWRWRGDRLERPRRPSSWLSPTRPAATSTTVSASSPRFPTRRRRRPRRRR